MKYVPLPPVLFYLFVGLMIVARWLSIFIVPFPSFWVWIGGVLIVLGVLTAFWGSSVFKQHETNIKTFNDPNVLVTTWPFRFTRNPMYIGMIAGLAGVAFVTSSVVGIVLLIVFSLITALVYIPYEEERMEQVFGTQFQDYSQRVRRWL